MGINKVNYGSTTLIDISNDTVTAGSMLSGTTAHDNSGAAITGTIGNGSATPATSLSASSDIGVGTVIGSSGKLSLSKTISNTPVVTPGYISSGTAGNTYVDLTLTTNVINTATITPTTSNQTIPSGTYCAGAQTIKGDANLVAANIASGKTIFGVSGSHTGSAHAESILKTNSSDTATSLAFTGLKGEPASFSVKLQGNVSRSSSSSYYYVVAITYDGSTTDGNYWRMSSGNLYEDSTKYSFTYSGGTLTVKSSGSRGAAGGSFHSAVYQLVYAY